MAEYLRTSGERRKPSRWPWVVVAVVALGAGVATNLWFRGLDMKLDTVWRDFMQPEAPTAEVSSAEKLTQIMEALVPIATNDATTVASVASAESDTVGEALALEAAGDLLGARELLFAAVTGTPQRDAAEEALGRVNVALLTTPRAMPGKVTYVIRPGDSLAKIASEFVCPVLLIQKINGIANPSRIQPGDALRVMDHPQFAITIGKRDNTLLVTLGGEFFKRYSVGTGEYGKTPTGTFVIDAKEEEPVWWKDGKAIPFGDTENILGTRWMHIEATGDTPPVSGYGIHGTWDNASLGKQSSAGCIRMKNADVEEVYMMVPRGTPVTIVE